MEVSKAKILLILLSLSLTPLAFAVNGSSSPSQTNNTQNVSQNETYTKEDDAKIQSAVLHVISQNQTLARNNLKVATNQGIVSVSGVVNSDTEAGFLVEQIQRVIGVKNIDLSQLTITKSQKPFRDTMITARIKGLLIREDLFGTKDLNSIHMTVETKNGVVYLSGFVENKQQITNAIDLIRTIPGVHKVVYITKKRIPVNNHSYPSTH